MKTELLHVRRVRLMSQKFLADDGLSWGYMDNGNWRELPKVPMLLAEMGPPPFDVTLPSGEVRHIIHQPEEP
jgi:hypothetical protein